MCAERGIVQKFIKPHCPWQNGKVERLNRTLATEWAYRTAYTSNAESVAALAPGSSSTTLNAATAPCEVTRRSAGCYQPDGRVQLGGQTYVHLRARPHEDSSLSCLRW